VGIVSIYILFCNCLPFIHDILVYFTTRGELWGEKWGNFAKDSKAAFWGGSDSTDRAPNSLFSAKSPLCLAFLLPSPILPNPEKQGFERLAVKGNEGV
jgi:hypothetical protein